MNTLKPSYTKISSGDSTYDFDSSYFYEESTKSSGLNTIENEGVLSMFVAIDLDGVSTDDGIVIKDEKTSLIMYYLLEIIVYILVMEIILRR